MPSISPEELRVLVDRHAAVLELFARQWSVLSAPDVVQAAFFKLAMMESPPEPQLPWLFRVVRNASISVARIEARRKKRELDSSQAHASWFVTNQDDQIDATQATEALSQLPQPQREIIVARIWGELSFQEIADLMEISSSSAHRQFIAALSKLREKLGLTWITNK